MFVGILLSTILFHWKLKDIEIRTLQIVACLFNIVNCCLNLCLTKDIKFGLTTFEFVMIQTLFFDSIY